MRTMRTLVSFHEAEIIQFKGLLLDFFFISLLDLKYSNQLIAVCGDFLMFLLGKQS